MKKLILIISFLLIAGQAWGANWFAGSGDTDFNAVSGGTTSSVWNSNADGTSGTYLDWANQPSNGDVFIANGATIAIDSNIGSSQVTVTLTTEGTDYGGTDGGGFTIDISAVAALTLYTNITGGSTTCLAISGAGSSGTELTINGNITGGTSASADGVNDTHTGSGAIIAVTGNVTAGNKTTSLGYNFRGATGTVNITGNCTGVLTAGCWTGAGIMTVSGDCTGSNAGSDGHGCYSNSTGITVSGNIIGGTKAVGAAGVTKWTPSSALKYIKIDGGGTVIYASAVGVSPSIVAGDIKKDSHFIKSDTGADTTGTLETSGGGGSWGF